MSDEFNIFKNLDELRKTNFKDQLKSLQLADSPDLNDSQGTENDDFDFDSLLGNVKKSPIKKQDKREKIPAPEKKLKKGRSRQRSNSSDGSISPTMPLLENLSEKITEMPVAKRTRRALGIREPIIERDNVLQNITPSPSNRGRSRGKAGGRGRGRGRGRFTRTSNRSNLDNTTDILESSHNMFSIDENGADISTLNIMERLMYEARSRATRARRQQLAEIAARTPQVDFVDLISSPMPRVEGFIDLDSDTEEPQIQTSANKKLSNISSISALDISYEDDNPEINIKVNWKGKPEAFKLRKHQKFSAIFEQLAERENISKDSIVFNINNRIILADDTPDSIDYKIFHFIDGRVLANHFNTPGAVAATGKKRDVNQITLKIQSDKWKRPLQINVTKTDKFRILYIKCAEELKIGLDQLKLSFDGELLELNDTPTDLDFEGGEAIDLHIKN